MTSLNDRLGWYVARLRAMSPAEAVWRAGAGVVAATGRARPRRASVLVGDNGPAGWEAVLARFRSGDGRPVLLGERAEAVAAALPGPTDAVVAAAEAALAGWFGFFGQQPVQYPGPMVDWNLDARTGHHWPDLPAASIDHRTQPADPKWIWELNRLQHLPWLAQAWLFTGERRFADGALDQLDTWLDQNPSGHGIAWRGGFEAGVRAMSVAVALQGLREAPGLTTDRFRRIVTMLADSAELAWRQRSRFSSANNHLLGELAGIAVVAMLFPELADATRLETRALAGLAREADRQFLPDGAGAEQSTAYQMFGAELLAVPSALLRLRGDTVPAPIAGALRRGSGFLRALVAGGEPLPRYGDDDGGFALRLGPEAVPSLDRHLAVVNAVTGPALWPPTDLAAAWLGMPPPAADGRIDPDPDTTVAAPPGDLHAQDGGLVVLRRDRRRLTMDVGPLGYLSIAAHGHSDALSVTVTVDGQEVIGDPGTGSYYSEPAWRDAFRGTLMHPTAAVDDLNQSVSGGPFLWVRHAATTVRSVDLQHGVVDAEHDGYTRLPEPVTHRRVLVAPPGWDTTVVVDLLTGAGSHRVRTSWPVHPACTVRPDGATHVIERDGVAVLRITTAATTDITPFAVRGDATRRLGWWSHRFESRLPAWLVGAVAGTATLPLVVASLLCGGEITDATISESDDTVTVSWIEGRDRSRSEVKIDTALSGSVVVERVAQPATGEKAPCAG